MAIEPIKGFYVHDEVTDTDGVAKVSINGVDGLEKKMDEIYEPPTITLESGTYQDTNGTQKYANANRARNAEPVDLKHCLSLAMPDGYSMTALFLDADMVKVGNANWINSLDINNVPSTARYLNFYIRNNSTPTSSIVSEIPTIQSGIIAKFVNIEQLQSDIADTNEKVDALEQGTVEPNQIAKKSEPNAPISLDVIETYQNSYIQNYNTTTLAPNVVSGGTNTLKVVKASTDFKLQFARGADSSYNYGNVVTFTGYYSATRPNAQIKGFTITRLEEKTWCTLTDTLVTIDLSAMVLSETPDMSLSWDMMERVYVSVPNSNDAVYALYPNGVKYSIDDFKWLDEATDTDCIVPKKWIVTDGGIEYNFYKDNCLLGRRIDDVHLVNFAVTDGDLNTNWYQDKYRTIWKPNRSMVTDRKLTLKKYDNDLVSLEIVVSCVSVPSTSGSGKTKKCLVIGDSKVAGGRITQRLYTRCDDNGMTLTMLGTIAPWDMAQYSHEGRSGWSAYNYTHDATYGGVSNPFYNNGFDFSYYMTEQGYTDVDYVYINLGVNDVSLGYENSFIDNINTMVTSIHAYDSNIKIIIGLCEGQCTRYYNANVLDFNEKIQKLHIESLNAWDDRETDNIFVCPIYLSMDMFNDFNMTEVPLSQNDEIFETGKTRWQVNDITHQSNVGYGKNADYMFAIMQYIESLES